MRPLLIATSNKGKITEISESLIGIPHEIITPSSIGFSDPPPDETGDTFAANAMQKAIYYYELGKVPTVADDSGILIDAIAGELGIHTRRWGAGADASDAEWIDYFLKRMQKEKNRKARFVCNLAFIDDEGLPHTFEGVCEGSITEELEADYLPGLPISACFRPDGFNQVYSAMSVEEKNAISHRGKAVAALRSHLIV
ncbi:non-canonical purine NTP pyrophosphatase [Candidatus Peregrinibacteria bacterium]|jgi:XTP/dITP diphosphohydrolase|nr:non-canonical purine NTP pyrophosphatase [Candidatus Peregrinibacteria bacterium]MBT3598629.1 non-canonical purine NTP pyrophosphatase [Candidatus Peregrinibacteria bacterium]MBT4367250.1 non-canonical purine NTP pyrophosphatase [Candidatus Peregrinibacteria bacterium]MBT4585728.1 non-canonical purine NTP pyrophosphatase [Candidatus Peregrinibacteria bacterium]MBT6730972.1 non-canonical purine NTP pyrophosphatase [Candidatus Peregrinibacteria bacterium]